jgi:putative PIN family toxin of toxin-antitoxin system
LDTDVVVAAMRSPGGASAEILRLARSGKVQLLANVALALEYEAICGRAEHRRAAALSDTHADVFVTAVVALTEPVESHFLWRPQLRDPGDEMVLEAAVNGRADGLVTFNKRDFGEASIRFGVEILSPREALERIRE